MMKIFFFFEFDIYNSCDEKKRERESVLYHL